jgi:C-terminal processing protease CtpA/Prc
MCLKFKQILVFALFTLFVFNVNAVKYDQCATIKFDSAKTKNGVQIFEPISHNNEDIGKLASIKKLLNDEQFYYVSPGWHRFNLNQWSRQNLLQASRKQLNGMLTKMYISSNIKPLAIKQVAIFVAKDHEYTVTLREGSDDEFIFKSVKKKCVTSNPVLTSRSVNSPLKSDIKLPDELEYRLRRLMTEIAKSQPNYSKSISNMQGVKISPYFGVVVDSEYQKAKRAIKVLAVSPYSMSAKLGLLSDDSIIKLGSNSITDFSIPTVQQLNNYLSTLKLGENIEMIVLRKGNEIALSAKYYPIIVPSAQYQIFNNPSKTEIAGE